MTEMTLTLKKDDLLAKLRERLTQMSENEGYGRHIKEIRELIDSEVTADTLKDAMVEWYQDILNGIEEGRYDFTERGSLRGAPSKPKLGGLTVKSKRRNHWSHYSKADLEEQLAQYESQQEDFLRPVQTAIDLLELSTEETVTINSGDYQKLLSGDGRRYY